MKTGTSRVPVAGACLCFVAAVLAGCGRDTRVNSDPGPGRPSRADGGERTLRPDPNAATPAAPSSSPATGTDSTGRPGDASGGATGAGAGSGTSGTKTQNEATPPTPR
jgi:hypothetical protein